MNAAVETRPLRATFVENEDIQWIGAFSETRQKLAIIVVKMGMSGMNVFSVILSYDLHTIKPLSSAANVINPDI